MLNKNKGKMNMITLFCAEKLNIFFKIKEPSTTWYLIGYEILAEVLLITYFWCVYHSNGNWLFWL